MFLLLNLTFLQYPGNIKGSYNMPCGWVTYKGDFQCFLKEQFKDGGQVVVEEKEEEEEEEEEAGDDDLPPEDLEDDKKDV